MTVGVRARRKAQRPGEILDAAFEEFVGKGYAGTRLEDVAARAGVTKGTIYVYFESKEALFVALVRDLTRPILERIEGFLPPAGSPAPAFLRGYLQFLYHTMAENPRSSEVFRLLIAEASRFPELVDEHYQACMRPLVELVREGLDRGVARGELREAPTLALPEVLLGPALALNIWIMLFADRKPIDSAQFLEAHLDLILNGLLPRS